MAGRPDRRTLLEAALTLLTAGVLIGLCFRALAPFVASMVWAAILAIAAWPLADHLERRLGWRRQMVATLIGAGYFVLLALPLIYLSLTLRTVFRDIWAMASDVAVHGLPPPPGFVPHIPVVGPRLARLWQEDVRNLAALGAELQSVLLDAARLALLQLTDVLSALGEVVFGIVLASQILAMGRSVPDMMRRFATVVGGQAAGEALAVTREAILAVAWWLIGCALVEAVLSGIGFWLAGLELASVLGFLCFVLRVLQIGPWPVWLFSLAWMLWEGSGVGKIVFLAGWFIVAVTGTVELIRPLLVVQRPAVPAPLLFLAVLGGLFAWGFSGMFLGAAALSVVASLTHGWLAMAGPASPAEPPSATP
ncbi:AI-2E family transporter [Rhodovastum atsumiense]|nr:AI-2E family transporter [Rhodovastum atsumiense]